MRFWLRSRWSRRLLDRFFLNWLFVLNLLLRFLCWLRWRSSRWNCSCWSRFRCLFRFYWLWFNFLRFYWLRLSFFRFRFNILRFILLRRWNRFSSYLIFCINYWLFFLCFRFLCRRDNRNNRFIKFLLFFFLNFFNNGSNHFLVIKFFLGIKASCDNKHDIVVSCTFDFNKRSYLLKVTKITLETLSFKNVGKIICRYFL